ncbi:MAG: glycosyltransferase family 2 protein, partial [Lentisphaerae bacterium]|nr:glycosyltransferase family 2 protein [Lentisphaerota bacterium]
RRACIVIPAYREERKIANVVERVRKYAQAVIVVDDGSPDRTAEQAAASGAVVLRHPRNLGKGAALNTAFHYAREKGFDYLITLDADGQHEPADIPRFIETYERRGCPVLIGNRMDAPGNMPRLRRWTNRLMSAFLSRAMGQNVPDTQCGFRLYRCDVLPSVETQAARFAAESEILLQIASQGVRLESVPITVIYNDELSKINPIRDTFRFFLMLARYYRGKSLPRPRG